jgi:AraC family ethanolamine operon transcriptional activator
MTPVSFDHYCQAVQQARVNFVLTKREEAPWWLNVVSGPSTLLQFGSDGGASVVHGTVVDESYILIGRHRPSAASITVNGDIVSPHDYVLLPPGCRFVFSADRSRTWFAISLPRAVVKALSCKNDNLPIRLTQRRAGLLPLTPDQNRQLVARAERMHALASQASCDAVIEAAEAELLSTVRDVLSNEANGHGAILDSMAMKANDTVTRALSSLGTGELGDDWYVKEMAEAAYVHPRTLLRAFHRVIGMGPIRYLRLRQLNLIRQQLYCATDDQITVTQIMQAAGASDMGRVSGSYKTLFGELPSETLRAALAGQNSYDQPRQIVASRLSQKSRPLSEFG